MKNVKVRTEYDVVKFKEKYVEKKLWRRPCFRCGAEVRISGLKFIKVDGQKKLTCLRCRRELKHGNKI